MLGFTQNLLAGSDVAECIKFLFNKYWFSIRFEFCTLRYQNLLEGNDVVECLNFFLIDIDLAFASSFVRFATKTC